MKTSDLISALNRLKLQTGSLVCLGCGYEHNCSTQGCRLIREAVDKLCGMEWIDPPLAQADWDGRVVVLPAKIGSEIYVLHTCKDGRGFYSTHEIAGMHLYDETGYRGAKRKEYLVLRRDGFSNHLDIDKIGKTAFLIREEAEKALERLKSDERCNRI